MAHAKNWARRLMLLAAVAGAGCLASAASYRAAGVALSLGELALPR